MLKRFTRRGGLIVGLIVTLAAAGTAAAPSANAKPQRKAVVVLDTFANNQSYNCFEFPIDDSETTNGYTKIAASFSVTQPTDLTSVVVPLVVGSGSFPLGTAFAPGPIQVSIVAGIPFAGGASYWNSIPNETAVVGRAATATVTTQWTICGSPQVVTVTFKTPARAVPGVVYWVLLQNPSGGRNTFTWKSGLTPTASSTNAFYIVDSDGSRWLSNPPETFRPPAVRVSGVTP